MGEFARALAMAQAAEGRWPQAAIRFVLSREAPYAKSLQYPSTLLDSSPTFHSPAVVEIIDTWRPDVVLFDNAGRTAQLQAAKRSGARVVYISARRRQRYKAFRLRWMRLIDEHWIAYPRLIAGDLTPLERMKLKFMHRPQVRFLDFILARRPRGKGDGMRQSILERLGCVPNGYTLVVPGGGTGHPGAGDAVGEFLAAARELAAAGEDIVFLGRAGLPARTQDVQAKSASAAASNVHLRTLDGVPQSDLADLMAGARLVITNGGSTLLQAIACGRACIAAPIAADQGERIRRCAQVAAAVAVRLDAAAIGAAAALLLRDHEAREALRLRAAALGLTDGIEVAMRALDSMLQQAP